MGFAWNYRYVHSKTVVCSVPESERSGEKRVLIKPVFKVWSEYSVFILSMILQGMGNMGMVPCRADFAGAIFIYFYLLQKMRLSYNISKLLADKGFHYKRPLPAGSQRVEDNL